MRNCLKCQKFNSERMAAACTFRPFCSDLHIVCLIGVNYNYATDISVICFSSKCDSLMPGLMNSG